MEKIVVDTSLLINHVRGKTDKLSAYLRMQKDQKVELFLPSVVLFEFYSGSSLVDKKQLELADLLISQFTIVGIDAGIARIGARLNRENKLQSRIDGMDILISAVCLHIKAKLATENKKHFQQIPGLKFA